MNVGKNYLPVMYIYSNIKQYNIQKPIYCFFVKISIQFFYMYIECFRFNIHRLFYTNNSCFKLSDSILCVVMGQQRCFKYTWPGPILKKKNVNCTDCPETCPYVPCIEPVYESE